MKKSKYFKLEELVPPEVFNELGDKAWELLKDDLIDIIDGAFEFIHEQFDTATRKIVFMINDWLWKGNIPGAYTESGYRVSNTTTGAKGSQHKQGGAADVKIKPIEAILVQRAIIEHQNDPRLAKITRMEANPPTSSWTHIDCEVLGPNVKRIHVFIP